MGVVLELELIAAALCMQAIRDCVIIGVDVQVCIYIY